MAGGRRTSIDSWFMNDKGGRGLAVILLGMALMFAVIVGLAMWAMP